MTNNRYIELYEIFKPYLLNGSEGLPERTDEEKIEYFKNPIFLDFDDYKINNLPEDFHELVKVNNLYYGNKKDEELDENILKMIDLEFLYIRNNCYTFLPKEIKRLKKLKVLFLDNNNLVDLPKELAELEDLYMLDCDSNNFKKIPDVLFKMKNLKGINLAGMSISDDEIAKLKDFLPNCEIDMSSDKELKFPF